MWTFHFGQDDSAPSMARAWLKHLRVLKAGARQGRRNSSLLGMQAISSSGTGHEPVVAGEGKPRKLRLFCGTWNTGGCSDPMDPAIVTTAALRKWLQRPPGSPPVAQAESSQTDSSAEEGSSAEGYDMYVVAFQELLAAHASSAELNRVTSSSSASAADQRLVKARTKSRPSLVKVMYSPPQEGALTMADRLQEALGSGYEQLDVGHPDGHGMSAAMMGGKVNKRRNMRLYVFLKNGVEDGETYFFDAISNVATSKRPSAKVAGKSQFGEIVSSVTGLDSRSQGSNSARCGAKSN